MQPEIRRYFQMEAKELIDKLTRGAAQLDGSTPDPANVQQMQRAAHTLKGAAHVVGELEIAQQAHAVEDLLAQQLKAPAAATAASVLALLDSVAARLQRSEPAAEAAGKTGLTPVREAAAPARPAVAHAPGASGFMHPGHSARTVRVELTQTERLLDHIGESTRLAASMRQALRAGAEAARPGRSGRYEQETGPLEHLDQLDRLDRQLSELFAVASQLRLIPTAELLFEVERMVRAHAATLGQPVACRASGGGERVDVHVLEVLEAALLHLVRNAIAHGIEPVAERRRQGKPETATITVDLRRAGSRILLTCADDGRGIDLEVIRRSAVEQGRCGPAEARRMGETELMALLFAPGFSTAGTIDQISGRGIGLDAVREAAESLDGHVQVRSTAGQGATFTIDVPSTLFAVRVLEIRAAGETFAIPFGAVEQTLLLAPHHTLVTVGERAGMALLMEGETVPFVRLNDLLPADPGSCEGSVAARSCLIVAEGGRRAAVAVDSFAGAGDLLIRPLPSFLGALPFVGGTEAGARPSQSDRGGARRRLPSRQQAGAPEWASAGQPAPAGQRSARCVRGDARAHPGHRRLHDHAGFGTEHP
jgi:two-component system chemotaxis sensor kinase CheA